jgi:putative colanic acid biosynthesis acetyltransferase WcaF
MGGRDEPPMLKEEPYMGQDSVTAYTRGEIVLRMLWAAVQSSVFRWSPRGWHRLRVGLLKLFGAEIPEPAKTRVYPTASIMFPWKLTLAPHTMIGPRVQVYNLGRVTLQRGANISQNCHLCAGTHDYNRWSMPLVIKPIVIGENVWLGADVFVGPGVTIGELAVVGARSVVVKDLPARRVCAGNPCAPIKDRLPPTSP